MRSRKSIFSDRSVVPSAAFHKHWADIRGQNHLYCRGPERAQEALQRGHRDSTILIAPPFLPTPTLPTIYSEAQRAAAQVVRAKVSGVEGDRLRLAKADWNFWEGLVKDAIPHNEYERLCRNGFPAEVQSGWHSPTLILGFRWARFEDLSQLEGLLYAGQKRSAPSPCRFRQRCYEADFVLIAATHVQRGIWAFCVGNYDNHDPKNGVHSSFLWVRPEVRHTGVGTYLVDGMRADSPITATVRTLEERAFWEKVIPKSQVLEFTGLAF